MIVTIENDFLIVKIKSKGAELNSVFNKKTQLEYMWSGDPAVWGKTSPILFPIVGTLKHDTFFYQDKTYSLSRHGFARETEFDIEKQQTQSVSFLLKSSVETLNKYPFHFSLRIQYQLEQDMLHVVYDVMNPSDEDLYFSIGAHPAFKVPLLNGTNYHDYYLVFNKSEDFIRWPISKEGLIDAEPFLFTEDPKINLTKDLFKQDALVFKHLKSNVISLKSDKHQHGLDFYFEGFPFMGIWAAPNADFVCIEPWCGIADSVNHDQKIETKEGINLLKPQANWGRTWKVKFY